MTEVIEHRDKVYIARNVSWAHGTRTFQPWSRKNSCWVRTSWADDYSFPSVEEATAFLEVAQEIATAVADADKAFVEGTEDDKAGSIDMLKNAIALAFGRRGIEPEKSLNALRSWFDDRNFHNILYVPSIGTGRLESAFILESRILETEGEPSLRG
jgi:hypothetical protein